MPEQEEINLIERLNEGLKNAYEQLLRRKAALGQNMVMADENGMPLIVPATEVLANYLRNK